MKIEGSVEVSNVVVVAVTALVAGAAAWFFNEQCSDDQPEPAACDRPHVEYADFRDPQHDRHQTYP